MKQALKIGVYAAALAVAAVLVAYRIHAYSLQSVDFAVRNVWLSGTDLLPDREVLAAAGIDEGLPVFSIDPADMKYRLECNPWIKEAVVRVEPPDGVRIEIQERNKFAYLWCDKYYPVSQDLVVLPGEKMLPNYDLPVISIPDMRHNTFEAGQRCTNDVVKQAAVLVTQYSESEAYLSLRLMTITPQSDIGMSFRCVFEGPFEVLTTGTDWPRELDTLLQLVNGNYTENRKLKYVDFTRLGPGAPVVKYQ